MSQALATLSEYYSENSLNANPSKTQVYAFHLNNHKSDYNLTINWNGERLENNRFPVDLGVSLDHTLSFKEHVSKTKAKVAARNNILDKLPNTSWGADPVTVKTTAIHSRLLNTAHLYGGNPATQRK